MPRGDSLCRGGRGLLLVVPISPELNDLLDEELLGEGAPGRLRGLKLEDLVVDFDTNMGLELKGVLFADFAFLLLLFIKLLLAFGAECIFLDLVLNLDLDLDLVFLEYLLNLLFRFGADLVFLLLLNFFFGIEYERVIIYIVHKIIKYHI